MQTLWTRVAQVRGSCRCPQCLHVAQGVARGAGTARANAIRPKYWTSSTLWYSGIFAAAATFDAGAKVQRREQWDQAIAEVKQELGQAVDVDQKLAARDSAGTASLGSLPRDVSLGTPSFFATDGLNTHTALLESLPRDVSIGTPSYFATDGLSNQDEALSSQADVEATLLDGSSRGGPDLGDTSVLPSKFLPLDPDASFYEDVQRYADSGTTRKQGAQWPVSTGHDLMVSSLPPQSIYATQEQKMAAETSLWTEKKLNTVELNTELLIVRFFQWVGLGKETMDTREWQHKVDEAANAVPAEFGNKIRYYAINDLANIEALRRKADDAQRADKSSSVDPGEPYFFQRDLADDRLCKFVQDETGFYRLTQKELNTSIRLLFDKADSGALSAPQYLAKVFYNISASTAPPNVDTYNILMTRLPRLQHHSLTKATIRSFLRTHIRPNEVSLAAMLNFRTDMDDEEGFRYLVESMTGQRRTFLMRAGRWVRRPEGYQYYGNRVLAREDNMVQKPYATPMVFTALCRGVLRFSGFDEVLRVMQSWAGEGWGLDIGGFSFLLSDCAARNDWHAGLAVWKIICGLRKKIIRSRPRRESSKRLVNIWTFADMLQLCMHAGEEESFERVMELALREHPGEDTEGVLMGLVKRKQQAQKVTNAEETLDTHPNRRLRFPTPNGTGFQGISGHENRLLERDSDESGVDSPLEYEDEKYKPFAESQHATASLARQGGDSNIDNAADDAVRDEMQQDNGLEGRSLAKSSDKCDETAAQGRQDEQHEPLPESQPATAPLALHDV